MSQIDDLKKDFQNGAVLPENDGNGRRKGFPLKTKYQFQDILYKVWLKMSCFSVMIIIKDAI